MEWLSLLLEHTCVESDLAEAVLAAIEGTDDVVFALHLLEEAVEELLAKAQKNSDRGLSDIGEGPCSQTLDALARRDTGPPCPLGRISGL